VSPVPPILVLGLGNSMAGDDAVGLAAARALREVLQPEVEVIETGEAGLALLDLVAGRTHLLVLDSVVTDQVPAGTVLRFSLTDLKPVQVLAPHYAGIPELVRVAETYGIPFPAKVQALAVAIRQPSELREGLSPQVEQAVSEVVQRAQTILARWISEVYSRQPA